MYVRVCNGTTGTGSPRNDADGLVVVTRGTMSRTGRSTGNVDEGYCVQVTALLPRSGDGERVVLSVERLYAPDRLDAGATNRIGTKGAYAECPPADAEVDAAVERSRAFLLAGGPAADSIRIRLVAGGEPGSQHVYRVAGTREELGREEAVRRAAEALSGKAVGADLSVERRPRHGYRWDPWRRYAVHPSGTVVRVDR